MSEVTLYGSGDGAKTARQRRRVPAQGYLAHKKSPTLGPYSRPVPRGLGWSYGGGDFLCARCPGRVTQIGPGRMPRHLFCQRAKEESLLHW